MPSIEQLLTERPLAPVDGDKRRRGTVLVVGGPTTCPGAALLAGTAALRAGAGLVQLAVAPDVAIPCAVAFPEAMVVELDLDRPVDDDVRRLAHAADAVLLGSGLGRDTDPEALGRLATDLRAAAGASTALLLDAGALVPGALEVADVLLPNADEASHLLGTATDVDRAARTLADRHRCIVAVRGERTALTAPDQPIWTSEPAGDTLGTAGSGDVLAGIVAALAARNPDRVAAVGWAIAVHAALGDALDPGALAHELASAVPSALQARRTRHSSSG